MQITRNVEGPNIRVLRMEENEIWLEPELRDTHPGNWWFYWHFAVEGAQGKTLRFHLGEHPEVGYFGAAVRQPGGKWHWGGTPIEDYRGFEYTFGEEEDIVEFCHDFRYDLAKWDAFIQAQGLEDCISTLAVSKKGRNIPFLSLGRGKQAVLLTSRHHACESTGTWMLEGFIREYLKNPLPDTRLLAVPFMDYDGVWDGDQGKLRFPHDHNRDYLPEPIYPSVRAVQKLLAEEKPAYFFDCHSPWHFGDTNDQFYIELRGVDMDCPIRKKFRMYLEEQEKENIPAARYLRVHDEMLLEKEGTDGAIHYYTAEGYVSRLPDTQLTATPEMPYFGKPPHAITEEGMLHAGSSMAKALKRIIEEKE